MVSALVDFHVMAKVKCIMDQFMEGLKALGLLFKIQANPNVWEPMFIKSDTKLTTGKLCFNTV